MTTTVDTVAEPALVERSLVACATGLLGAVVSGVLLAVVGWFHWLGVVVPGAVGVIVAWKTVGTHLSPGPWGGGDRPFLVATAAVIILLTGLSVFNPAEHLLAGRDPATYLATAGWLAESGNLLVEARSGPFVEVEGLEYSVNGFYDNRADGRLAPQFFHAFPVLLATAGELFGMAGMLAVNPLLGGLALWAIFALTARLATPGVGLLAVLLLGLNPVFVYFTRATFTEPLTLIFLTTGFWLLVARDREDRSLGLLAGLLLGGAVMARVDSLLIVIPLLILVSLGNVDRRAETKPVLRGFLLTTAFGLGESVLISPWYIGGLDRELLLIGLGVAAALSMSLLPDSVTDRVGTSLHERRTSISNLVVIAVGAALLFGIFVRPVLGPTTGTPYDLAAIQETNQLPIEPDRTYAEYSIHWLLWYVGPVALLLGFAGLAYLSREKIRKWQGNGSLLWLLTVAVYSGAYLWRPSINPDHIWAMRRFLPVVFPGLAVGAAWAVGWMARSNLQRWRVTAVAVAAVAVGGVGYAYADVWDLHEFEGLSADFETACDAVGPDAAVLLVDSGESAPSGQLMQGFRSYCHVPAAAARVGDLSTEDVRGLASDWRGEGRSLVVLGADPALRSLAVQPSATMFDTTYPLLEYTLMRRPTALRGVREPVSFGRPDISDIQASDRVG